MMTGRACEVVQEKVGRAQTDAVRQHLAGEDRPLARDVRVVRHMSQLDDDGTSL
jgi:hypothetical protein